MPRRRQYTAIAVKTVEDEGRAFHSSYFEMLGEQGWPGWPRLTLQITGLWQMERLRGRWCSGRAPGAGRRSGRRRDRLAAGAAGLPADRVLSGSPISRSS
jgi:hypothetical protein